MATDIVDKELKAMRDNRWEKAFTETATAKSSSARAMTNRRATIVIEHIIQASDVSHTMQHWHIYRQWNERLFREMSLAYKEGRADKDPAEFWYKGEIGFFDFYIIPLAKKLKDCGVFGVSSAEYLNYAIQNRQEWESKGQEAVAEMVEKLKKDLEVSKTDATPREPKENTSRDSVPSEVIPHPPTERATEARTVNIGGGRTSDRETNSLAFL